MSYAIQDLTITTSMRDRFGDYATVTQEGQRLFSLYGVLSTQESVQRFLGRCKLAPADNADTEYIKALAVKAVKDVRRILTDGTFNNRMKGGPHRKKIYSGSSFGYMSNKTPRSMILTVEDLGNFLAEKWYPALDTTDDALLSQYLSMAGRGWGTCLAGGGVCSMVSHASMGVLTHHGYDLHAAIVYSSIDHSFVIIGRPSTCWYVVDPWVGNPHVCALPHCYFGADTITHAWPLHIVNAAPTEWGLSLTAQQLRSAQLHMAQTYREAATFDDRNNPEPDHAWAHESNLAALQAGNYGDPVATPLAWGDAAPG